MNTNANEETELLRRKLVNSKREAGFVALGFFWGAMAFGWIAQWYFTGTHLSVVPTALPLIGLGCAFFGALLAGLFVTISQLGRYIGLRRSETVRFEQEMFGTDSHKADTQ
jgi:hypothetical protein